MAAPNERTISVVLKDDPTGGMKEFLDLARRGVVPVEVEVRNDPVQDLRQRLGKPLPLDVQFDGASIERLGRLHGEKYADAFEQAVSKRLNDLNSRNPQSNIQPGSHRRNAAHTGATSATSAQPGTTVHQHQAPHVVTAATPATVQPTAHARRIATESREARQLRRLHGGTTPSPEQLNEFVAAGGDRNVARRALVLPQNTSETIQRLRAERREQDTLNDPLVLAGVGASAITGGIPGAVTAAAGAGLLGRAGVIAGLLVDPILSAFKEKQHEFEAAGNAYSRSVLSIASTLHASTQVLSANGAPSGNVGAQIRFQERQAEQIQLAARSKLLPLGIAGATESSFVSGITAALSQRGINANANQVALIAERLGGVIRAQRPQLLDNPALLDRDLQDVLSGSASGQRTVLGSLIRPSLTQLGTARSGADVVKALDRIAPFAEAVKNSDSIVALHDRIEGRRDQLNTSGGNAFFEAQKAGLKAFSEQLNSDDVEKAAATVGGALGRLSRSMLEFEAGAIKAGAAALNAVDPFLKLAGALAPLAPALAGSIIALKVATEVGKRAQRESLVVPFSPPSGATPVGPVRPTAAQLAATGQIPLIRPASVGQQIAAGLGTGLVVASLANLVLNAPAAAQESIVERNESAINILQRTTDRLQADRAEASERGQAESTLNAAGLRDQLFEAGAKRALTPTVKLSIADLFEDKFRNTSAFRTLAPDFFATRADVRSEEFRESTQAFTGLGGELVTARLSGLVAQQNADDALSEESALRRNRSERIASTKPVSERLAEADEEIAKRRQELVQAQAEHVRLNQPLTPEGLRALTANRNFDLASLPEQRLLAQEDLFIKQGQLRSAERAKAQIGTEEKFGNPLVVAETAKLVDASRKVLDYKNQEVEAGKRVAGVYLQLADTVKGAFFTGTTSGAARQIEAEGRFLGLSVNQQRQAASKLESFISDIDDARNAVAADLTNERDPIARVSLRREAERLDALRQAKELERETSGLQLNKIAIRDFENSLSQRLNRGGANEIASRLEGVDAGTFGGAILRSQLNSRKITSNIAANNAEIRDILAGNTNLSEDQRADAVQTLRIRNSGLLVQRQAEGRNLENAQFAQNQGANQLERAQIELKHLLADETAKRREVNDALSQSRRALEAFNASLDAQKSGASSSLAARARRIKEKGGTLPFGLDFDDQTLEDAELAAEVDAFNADARRLGVFGTARGGKRLNLVQPDSPLSQQLGEEGARLQDSVRKSAKALELLPTELEGFRLALRHTIADLDARLNGLSEFGVAGLDEIGKLPPPLGTPGQGLPSLNGDGFGVADNGSAISTISAQPEGTVQLAKAIQALEARIHQMETGKKDTFKIDPASIQQIGQATGREVGNSLKSP